MISPLNRGRDGQGGLRRENDFFREVVSATGAMGRVARSLKGYSWKGPEKLQDEETRVSTESDMRRKQVLGRMLILKIIGILLKVDQDGLLQKGDVSVTVHSMERLGSLLRWLRPSFCLHGKPGFHHIPRMNRYLFWAFLSLFLPHRIAATP
jgi:hypothetical protein